jgi:hypothetical protein
MNISEDDWGKTWCLPRWLSSCRDNDLSFCLWFKIINHSGQRTSRSPDKLTPSHLFIILITISSSRRGSYELMINFTGNPRKKQILESDRRSSLSDLSSQQTREWREKRSRIPFSQFSIELMIPWPRLLPSFSLKQKNNEWMKRIRNHLLPRVETFSYSCCYHHH